MAQAKDQNRRIAPGSIFNEKWEVVRLLGEGAFGAVYEVQDNSRPGKLCALKLESKKIGVEFQFVPLEVAVLKALKDIGARHCPGYESCGQNENFNYVVMGLVGKNVDALRKSLPTKKFSLHACLYVGARSLMGLEEIHRAGFLHRDFKPANMCIGRAPDDLRNVYVYWGLCRRYVNKSGQLFRQRETASFRGTPQYASADAMSGKDQGRVDDIWSWFFGLIELTVGKLPWDTMRCQSEDHDAYKQLALKKFKCTQDIEVMCHGCPSEYRTLFEMIKKLKFLDRPKYTEMLDVLKVMRKNQNLLESNVLDWEPTAEFEGHTKNVSNANMMHTEGRKKSI